MGKDKSIKIMKILSVACTEYSKWARDARMILLIAAVVFAKLLCTDTLVEKAQKFGAPMSVLEPFAAIGNSTILLLLIPAVFLVMMSDYPKTDCNAMFVIGRSGKINWVLGQILFAIFAVLSFLGAFFTLTVLTSLKYSVWSWSWSEPTRLYISRFPEAMNSYEVRLLPGNLYNQIPLGKTIIYTIALLALYLMLICFVLLLCKIIGKRRIGLYIMIGLFGLGATTYAAGLDIMWHFPMANSIIWLHYTALLREPIRPIWYSFAYFGGAILILFLACILLTRRADLLLEPGENQ